MSWFGGMGFFRRPASEVMSSAEEFRRSHPGFIYGHWDRGGAMAVSADIAMWCGYEHRKRVSLHYHRFDVRYRYADRALDVAE